MSNRLLALGKVDEREAFVKFRYGCVSSLLAFNTRRHSCSVALCFVGLVLQVAREAPARAASHKMPAQQAFAE